jgi:hypothetical protein
LEVGALADALGKLSGVVEEFRDGGESSFAAVEARVAPEERACVGVERPVEEVEDGGVLDGASGVHDADGVGVLGDEVEGMCDEQDGEVALLLEFFEELEDLRLHGDVEGGGGLVGEEELGLAGECDGDHDALAHAAGELVRVVVEACARVVDSDAGEGLERDVSCVAVGGVLVEEDGFDDLFADGVDGVEAGHGLLEDHGGDAAADSSEVALGEREDVGGAAVEWEEDASGVVARGGGVKEAEDAECGDGFAGARLAHEGEGLCGVDGEAEVIDSAAGGFVGAVEGDDEVVDGEDRGGRVGGHGRGSRRSRRFSPMML